jgi:hypothetical protein
VEPPEDALLEGITSKFEKQRNGNSMPENKEDLFDELDDE